MGTLSARAMSTRVTFRFPGDSLIRYVDRVPVRGDRVRDVHGRRFVVATSEPDDAGGSIARCVTPVGYTRETRMPQRSVREKRSRPQA
jgi:hypothetical protein